jgi:hypothetical protein
MSSNELVLKVRAYADLNAKSQMSLVASGVTSDRLIFSADTLLRLRHADGTVQQATGLKVTAYHSQRGNLLIGHAGMWGDTDAFVHVVDGWMKGAAQFESLCDQLAGAVAWPTTVESQMAGLPNLTEFLVGLYPSGGTPVLAYVSSNRWTSVPVGTAHVVGGDPAYNFLQQFPLPPDGDEAAGKIRRAVVATLSGFPSEAYGFPISETQAKGPEPDAVSVLFFDSAEAEVAAPSIDLEIPPRL